MNILVTGGAGYIGSHTVRELEKSGHRPLIYDSFITGTRDFCRGFETVEGDIGDYGLLVKTLRGHDIHCVMNFASFIAVGESVGDPLKYYDNNVAKTVTLLRAMRDCRVELFIFSSSAAVYGYPEAVPVIENSLLSPINPYGQTKRMIETVLEDSGRAHGMRSVMLRYFNAAGADVSGEIGENHRPETHLIPLAIRSILEDDYILKVFGDDYPTPDGSCIRDYVHVNDLAAAHVLAADYLGAGGQTDTFNLGNGNGFSVFDIIGTVEKVTGKSPRYLVESRRAGDPPSLVASSEKARSLLGWAPRFHELEAIVETAWAWEKSGFRRGW